MQWPCSSVRLEDQPRPPGSAAWAWRKVVARPVLRSRGSGCTLRSSRAHAPRRLAYICSPPLRKHVALCKFASPICLKPSLDSQFGGAGLCGASVWTAEPCAPSVRGRPPGEKASGGHLGPASPAQSQAKAGCSSSEEQRKESQADPAFWKLLHEAECVSPAWSAFVFMVWHMDPWRGTRLVT